jgi:subfamily B ATP-binding cassette protein MsbA
MTDFFGKLWVFVRPYRGRFYLGLLCGVFYGLSQPLLIAVLKVVLGLVFNGSTNFSDQLEKAPHFHSLAHWLALRLPEFHAPRTPIGWTGLIGAIPTVMLLRVTLAYLSIYLTNWSAMHAIADIRTKLFSHLQNLSLGFFNQNSTGDLIARVTNDTQVLYGIIGGTFASMVKDPVSIIGLLGSLLLLQPTLTLISMVVFPICIVPIVIYGRKVRKSARAVQQYNAELTNLMHESFTGTRVIKAYNLEETVSDQFRATTRKYVSQLMRVIRANEIPSQLMELFGACGITLVFLYILSLPPDQRPHMEDFTTFALTMVLIYPAIKSLTRMHNQIHQARAASERVFELLAIQNTIAEPTQPRMLHSTNETIEFTNLDFNYGDKPILRNINLTIQPGQLVGLVGGTGSGKTTLANLLLRFYDPTRGSIRIGGVDIREVSTRDRRNHIAVVAQETVLFNDTIRRNIELGRLGAASEDIIAAARHAHAYDFIMDKPQGFDTVIGEKGVTLSGGQRQRLAIARAVLKSVPILILDEATSALDTESERAVQTALDELMKGRTTICIAHRLSTIRHADVIVVLDRGRIAETGTHEQLFQRGGVYRKLHDIGSGAADI